MAQGIFSVVKSEREKVESAFCHVCKINFVRTTGHFIRNLLTNLKASTPLNEILTGNFKLLLNCVSNLSARVNCVKISWGGFS